MGWYITLLILFLLSMLPLGVCVKYTDQGPVVKVILGPAKILLFPRPKKATKTEKKKTKSTDAKPSISQEPALKNPAPSPAPKETKEKGEKGGSFLDFLPLLQLAFRFLGDFRRKLRLNHLELKLIMAGGDPANLAINYGRAWAAVGNLMPQLDRIFVIKNRDVEVECDFTASETLIFARLDLSITLGRLLSLVFVYAIRALKEYLTIQKKRKGGAAI